jgi:hypothetical protein
MTNAYTMSKITAPIKITNCKGFMICLGAHLEQHLHHCVPEGIQEGREEAVIEELVQLYTLAGNR